MTAQAQRRVVSLPVGEGAPEAALSNDLAIPFPIFDSRLAGGYPDTLLAVNPVSEEQVMREGGMMCLQQQNGLDPAHYAAGNLAVLTDFPLSPGRNAVKPGAATTYPYLGFDLHGLLANDEWTIQGWVKSVGDDITNIAAVVAEDRVNIWSAHAGAQYLELSVDGIYDPPQLRALLGCNETNFLVAGTDTQSLANLSLTDSDFPADTWVPVTVSYDQTSGLTLILGGESPPSAYATLISGTSGRVAHWRMSGSSLTEADVVGSSTGTYTGAANVTKGQTGVIKGHSDTCARFPGTSGAGYLTCGNHSSIQLATGTVEVWVKIGAVPVGSWALNLVKKSGAYALEVLDGFVYTEDYGAGASHNVGAPGISADGAWHHVAMTFAPGSNNTKIYIDGVLKLTITSSVLNQASALTIGEPKTSYPATDVQAYVDEPAVYNVVLTQEQIQQRVAFKRPQIDSSGSPNAQVTRAWGEQPSNSGGLLMAGIPGNLPGYQEVEVTVPSVLRYSRYKAKTTIEATNYTPPLVYRDAPKLTIDVENVEGDWTPYIGGVVDHNSDYYEALVDGTFSDTGNAQWDLLGELGCPLVRAADNSLLAEITALNGSSPPTIDFTKLDNYYGRIVAAGNPAIHAMVGYVPAAIQIGGNANAAPTDYTTFAQWQSAVFGRMVELGCNIASISFWNEPGLQWYDGETEFVNLFWETAQQLAADHPALPNLGGPDAEEDTALGNYGFNMTKSIVDKAELEDYQLGGVYLHSYATGITETIDGLDSVKTYVAGKFSPECPIRLTEWGDYSVLVAPGGGSTYYGAGGAGYAIGLNVNSQLRTVQEGAKAYAKLWEAMDAGADMATYYTMAHHPTGPQPSPAYPGMMSGDLDGTTGEPRAFPILNAFTLLWKHSGDRVACASSFPHLRGICTVDGDTITLTYGTYKRAGGPSRERFHLEWANLPASFRWKQWAVDSDTVRQDGRLPLVASGNQDNLPLSVELSNTGVGGIQIT